MSTELTTFRTKDLALKDIIEAKLNKYNCIDVCISKEESITEDILNYFIVDDLKIKIPKKKKTENEET